MAGDAATLTFRPIASFYAELTVDGQTYPVRACQPGFSQPVDARGRVQAKVRHHLLHLTPDVPTADGLLAWAAAPFQTQAGHLTFFAADQQTPRETVSFAAGQCVGYQEHFAAGAAGTGAGAYVCQLTLASPALAPGGPAGPYVPAAARGYAAPAAGAASIAKASGELATPVDLMRFERPAIPLSEKLQRLKTGYLGSRRMNRRELATLSTELKAIGIQLIIDKKGVLPDFARAGFDPANGKLYLRKGDTHFEAFHEKQHAEQWVELGISDYTSQSRFEREKYVFDAIINNKESFSEAEIAAATNYIKSLS